MKLLDSPAVQPGLDLSLVPSLDDGAATHVVLATNGTTHPLHLGRVVVRTDLVVTEFVEHGYQSWSTVRPTIPSDYRSVRAQAPRWFRNQMLADGESAGRALCADTVLVHSGGLVATTWLDGPPLTMLVNLDGGVAISMDLDGIVLEPGETRHVARLRSVEGPAGPLLSEWAALTGIEAAARTRSDPPFGWCSWYQYFTEVTADDVVANLRLAAEHELGLVQIDDGWQRSIGEWSGTSERFGMPIGDLADHIRQQGLSAGIWTAPFLAVEGSPLATANPSWLVTNEAGRPRTALHHGGWGGRVYALDLSQASVIEHLAAQFTDLAEMGFDYFKIDFLHAGMVPGQRRGSDGRTRTEYFTDALSAIRGAIGDTAYLLGCGSPLAPAVGLVDGMRLSEDVAPHWGPGDHFPGWSESSVGTANAIEASVRRAPLHRRWYAGDPDCVLLRPSDTDLTNTERHSLVATVAGTGGFTVLSDDLRRYGAAEWDLVEALRAAQPVVDEAVDLVDPLATSHLELIGPAHHLVVDLDRRTASVEGPDIPALLTRHP